MSGAISSAAIKMARNDTDFIANSSNFFQVIIFNVGKPTNCQWQYFQKGPWVLNHLNHPKLTGKVLVYLELPFEHTGKPARPDNLKLARELGTHLPTYHTYMYIRINDGVLGWHYCCESIFNTTRLVINQPEFE